MSRAISERRPSAKSDANARASTPPHAPSTAEVSRPTSRARSRPPAGGEEVSNVHVVCRVRPMSEREKATGMVPVVSASSDRREVVVARSLGGRQVRTTFSFDGVLGSFSNQEDVFTATVRPLIEQVLSGYEATAFAYGQTGTGKTWTMEGDPEAAEGAGLMPRAAAAVLTALADAKYAEHTVTVSYLEIYNEDLSD